jgi:hypothetical protein
VVSGVLAVPITRYTYPMCLLTLAYWLYLTHATLTRCVYWHWRTGCTEHTLHYPMCLLTVAYWLYRTHATLTRCVYRHWRTGCTDHTLHLPDVFTDIGVLAVPNTRHTYPMFLLISLETNPYLLTYVLEVGARGSVVVKALCYKPEGRGFVTD